MILRLAAVCEAVRERPDGRLDLIGVFNELSATGFPARQDRMTAVFIVEWAADEAGRQPLRADMIDEQGRKLLTIQGHTDVDARGPDRSPPQTRLVMPLENVVFKSPGRYRFELLAGSDVVDACSFFVGEVADSAADGPPP
ncbi:hypothetical protein BH23GEM9_BH23GEM9_02190 [soil metagenome]